MPKPRGWTTGTTPNNAGLVLATSLAPIQGAITLSNVQGGGPLPGQSSTSANNFGLMLNSIQLSAPTLLIEGIQGGSGSGKNAGLYICGGTLGSSTTTTLTVAASSHGTGSTEVGILIDNSGIVQCADSGIVTLVGFGSHDASGSENYGVELSGASFLIGDTGGAASATLSVIGQGPLGIGIDTAATTITLSNASSSATFTGLATQGNGIRIDAACNSSLLGAGSLLLTGTGGSGFDGIAIDAAITAYSTISLTLQGATSSTSTSNGGISIANGAIALIGIQDAPILLNTTTISSTAADITVTGPVILQSSTPTLTTSSGNITFNDTIDGAFGLSTTASGTLSFLGNIGSTTPLTTFSTTASTCNLNGNAIIINGGINASSGVILTQTGALTLAGPVTLTGGTFAEFGGGTVSLATTVTTSNNTITFNSPISLTASATINAGSSTATFNRTTNGTNSRTVTAGTAIFASDIGNTTPISTLSVTATTIQVAANQSVTTSVSHTGAVTLLAPVTLTNSGAGTITITGAVTGNYSLMLLAPQGSITLTSTVNLSSVGSTGEHLYASAGGAITCGDTLTTSGTFGGNVTLISSTGNVSIGSIDTHGTAGDAGNIYLQPGAGYTISGTLGTIPNGLLLCNSSTLDASSTGGQDGYITLAPLGRATPMSIATISSSTDLIITGGALTVGAYEAMTVFGSLTITVNGYSSFADIVALNTINITAGSFDPAIFLISRASTQLLDSTGAFYASPNTHILAGTALTISGGYVPSTLNVAVTPILAAQLIYLGTVLNYDNE